jgi:hypothetical protein
MNKKGQLGLLAYIFMFLVFIVVWAAWLGGFLTEWGQIAIANNNMTGLDAFFFANLNIWVIFGVIIGVFIVAYMGVSQ